MLSLYYFKFFFINFRKYLDINLIKNNDVFLLYFSSKLIHRVLRDVHKSGKKISVIVVDGRPRLEGTV